MAVEATTTTLLTADDEVGVRLVWVVHPVQRSVMVYTPITTPASS